MSVVPTSTLPRCTRTIVFDVLFMRKYSLSQTQVFVLYYLLMLKNWVKFREGDFYVILSKKIEDDLQIHPKTVEASITKLKQLQLIETKRVMVKEWNRHRTYRAIAITPLGKEYNLGYYKESDYQHALELEKENETYRVENDKVHCQNMELESKNSDLEFKSRSFDIQKALESKASAPKKMILKEKKSEAKAIVSKNIQKIEEDIDIFRKKIIKEYAQSGKPICNAVSNQDKWAVDTKFYINSYSRLSISTKDNGFKQIGNPQQVNNFWRWLFDHQHRVGEKIDTKKVANIRGFLKFIGKSVSINNITYKIKNIKAVVGGVKVYLEYNNKIIELGNSYGNSVIDIKRFGDWLLNFSG